MHIREILPFVIPTLLFQLFMQVLFIVESIKDKGQKPLQRALYIMIIALFGLPAISFYLFKAEKTPPKDTTPDEVERAAHFNLKGIFFLLLIAYQVMGVHMLEENIGTPTYTTLVTLLTISYILMLLYNMIPEDKRPTFFPIFPILQLILCIPIQFLDHSGDNLFLSIIAGFSAINYAPINKASKYGIGTLSSYIFGNIVKVVFMPGNSEMSQLVRYFFVNVMVVLLAIVAFYTLKKHILTSIRLEHALNTVKEQADQLKGLAVIEERSRIAAEMHDSVGHTLTAAVMTLEEAEKSITKQPLAAKKVSQGKEQVRRGLSELRTSVRAVREGRETGFVAAFEQLLREIQADTVLDIQSVVDTPVSLFPLQAGILLSAVKECATNAIKHGHATRADILIQEHKGQLRLTFTDNGIGSSVVRPGSGLNIMQERMYSIGGALEIESAPGEGFTVSLVIPAAQQQKEETL